jgi:hypothetical protein
VAAAVVLSVWAAPALAGPASVVVSPGAGLTVAPPAVGDFAVVTPGGPARSAEAQLGPFAVNDARGTGEGWTVTIQATSLRAWDGTGYVPGGVSLPPGSLTLPGLAVAPDGTDSPAPATAAGPYPLGGTAVTVARAHPGSAMGRYTFTPTAGLRVTVPADAPTGTYRSDVSVSVTSGP